MSNKILAVAVVAVIAIAAVSAVLLTGDDDDKTYRSENSEGRLLIMGNANNDDYLDGDDVSMIQRIIDEKLDWRSLYPLADANNDKIVDDKDIEMVKKMIDRVPMKVNYAYLNGDELVIDSIQYPVRNMLVVGDNVALSLKSIGAGPLIRGIALSDADDPIYSDLSSVPSIKGASTTVPSISLISNVADKDSVLVTSTSSRYVTNEAEIEKSNVPVLRFNVDGGESGLESINGILTIGYLLQKEDAANEYVRFCDDILKTVKEKTDGLTKKTLIATNRTSNVSGLSSEYYQIPVLAGGKNVITKDEMRTSFKAGDDWLYEYDFQYIIHSTSLGYGDVDEKKEYDTYIKNFKDLQASKDGNFVLINANVPAPIRVAYIASVLYPDEIGADYGSEMHQEFIDRFMSNLSGSYDVLKDGSFVIRG